MEKPTIPLQFDSLPEDFVNRMKAFLGTEFEEFKNAYASEPVYSLRLNTLKQGGDIKKYFKLIPVLWNQSAYYYNREEYPGKHPLHEAGAYYIQEASAMIPAEHMDIRVDLKVLDLCAAPGGKSTQIASAMAGSGLLVSNEIVPKRAKILSENLERLGVKNAVVLNESPERLSHSFPGFFDRILVDAPCSGEGMFRKNPEAVKEWSLENVIKNAERQLDILNKADIMLSDGGRLVYSTCTFAPEEDEEVLSSFLDSHPWYEVVETKPEYGMENGRKEWTKGKDERVEAALRLFPHKAGGEGHFAAILRKKGAEETAHSSVPRNVRMHEGVSEAMLRQLEEFTREVFDEKPVFNRLLMLGDTLCAVPAQIMSLKGLKLQRVGLELGKVRAGRFVPNHAWAMALNPGQCRSYEVRDVEEARAYRRGEVIRAEGEKGWEAITFEGYTMGWGRSDGHIIKNHYPKGLRGA
ncbi:MAG: RsmB/NOP family class I SAM-dependent RNA methyltransferase [Lachnospiraceae bacterium]|nr:RsmB/NOP family class I SAM-dependent RNA methyltransferase [Lachnospiraceae bacterium]